MNALTEKHCDFNRRSVDAWQCAAEHRNRVTQLLIQDTVPGGILEVLGAGNCNDLDLVRLTAHFGMMKLYDIDTDAIAAGVARQSESIARFQIMPPTDLSGIIDLLEHQPTRSHERNRWESELTTRLKSVPSRMGKATVVASVCVVSQMIQDVLNAFASHMHALPFIRQLRHRHLHDIVTRLAPGGRGILITDFVSSETVPELAELSPLDLLPAAKQWIESGNFFTGLNPATLAGTLHSDPVLAELTSNVRTLAPWVWNHGARHYAVVAIQFQRRPK